MVERIRRKSKIPLGPVSVDAEAIEVTRADEKWSIYELDDGTTLRFRAIITEVWRAENKYDADGNPIYVVKSQNVLVVQSPEPLKGKVSR